MVHIIATINLVEGVRDSFLKEFNAIVPLVRAEAGCILYVPTVDVPTEIPMQGDVRPDTVTVVEQWESLDALADHLMAPHMQQYRAKIKDLVQSVALQVLQPADVAPQ